MMEEIEKNSHGLKSVAVYLESEAFNVAKECREVFARSVYNRYYYASFFHVRGVLIISKVKKYKEKVNHNQIPALLRSNVYEKLKEEAKKADENNDERMTKIIIKAFSSRNRLAVIMEDFRAARTAADYNHFDEITFRQSSDFSLKFNKETDKNTVVKYTDIINWHENVVCLTKNILKVWI